MTKEEQCLRHDEVGWLELTPNCQRRCNVCGLPPNDKERSCGKR